MKQVINSKTIVIVKDSITGAPVSININNLNFIPHEVIVKQLSWKDGTSTDKITTVYSDLSDNQPLCIFTPLTVQDFNPNTRIMLNKPIQGNIQLVFINEAGAKSVIAGAIGLVLEFNQYLLKKGSQ